jgi:molybdenum cofactor synthesis domain-containing protein
MSSAKKYRAQVISISTRAALGVWEDTSGPLIVDKLRSLEIECLAPIVIADGEVVETTLRKAVADGVDLIITTGGTGHTPNDLTPEMTNRVIDKASPGISEAIRNYGISQGILTSALSRAVAGIARKTLIINLPGSNGGVKDGLKVLEGILLHALDQIHGGDHVRKD